MLGGSNKTHRGKKLKVERSDEKRILYVKGWTEEWVWESPRDEGRFLYGQRGCCTVRMVKIAKSVVFRIGVREAGGVERTGKVGSLGRSGRLGDHFPPNDRVSGLEGWRLEGWKWTEGKEGV